MDQISNALTKKWSLEWFMEQSTGNRGSNQQENRVSEVNFLIKPSELMNQHAWLASWPGPPTIYGLPQTLHHLG